MGVTRVFLSYSAMFLFAWSAKPQGQIIFANRALPMADGSGTYDAPIELASDLFGRVVNTAALLRVKAGGTLELVGTTQFRTDQYSNYFASSPTVTIDGVPPGQTAVFVVRVYNSIIPAPVSVSDSHPYATPYQSKFFRSLPLGDGQTFPIPKTTGLLAFGTPPPGPGGDDINNRYFFEYLKRSVDWKLPNVFDEIPANSTDLPMWKIYAPVDYVLAEGFVFGFKKGTIDLSSSAGPGHISRTAVVTSGIVSTVRFSMSGNPDPAFANESPIKTVRVTVAGNSYVFSYDIAAQQNSFTNMRWRQIEIPFIANSTAEEIHFESLSTGQAGPMLDNVWVAPGSVPPIKARISATGEVSWDSWIGFKYRVEKSLAIGMGANWVSTGAEITASAQVTTFSGFDPATENAFYRIRVNNP